MKKYFEGWYYKLVDASETSIYAIIPGISFDSEGGAHSFIQFFDGISAEMNYFKFKSDQFDYSNQSFEISIENNFFSRTKLSLDLKTQNTRVTGTITSSGHIPWIASIFEGYSCMGWYRYVPRMECYHGIISFDHLLTGKLKINDTEIDFTGGKGYLEKDYGKSFPRYYLWCQSNHFDVPQTSIILSFAKIPWLFSYFDGFLAGIVVQGKLYKFTTYSGAKVTRLRIIHDQVEIHLEDDKHRLEVIAHKGQLTELSSPIDGSMTGRILETITATLNVILVSKKDNNVLFEGVGRNGGLDLGGKIDEIPQI